MRPSTRTRWADLRGAIGFRSFTVLTYYAITNAAAWTLPPQQRRWSRLVSAAGVVGCLLLSFTLPTASVIGGAAVLFLGASAWVVRRWRSRR